MDTFDLLVVFKDGSEMVIEGVYDYKLELGDFIPPIISVKNKKSKDYSYFNWNEVRYCGRLIDLR